MPAFYMMIACAIDAVALYFVTETAGCAIGGRGTPGEPLPASVETGDPITQRSKPSPS